MSIIAAILGIALVGAGAGVIGFQIGSEHERRSHQGVEDLKEALAEAEADRRRLTEVITDLHRILGWHSDEPL